MQGGEPMRRTTVLLAALALAALPARAGDASNPEIDDPPNDAGGGNTWGDITIGFVNDTASDIVVTLSISLIPPSVPNGYVYYWLADIGTGDNATMGCALFFFANSPQYGCAHWDREQGPTDDLEGTGSFTPGQPGTVVLNLPRSVAMDPPAGTAVTALEAGTGTVVFAPIPPGTPIPISVGQFIPDDVAAAERDYALAQGPAAGAPGGPSIQGPGGNGSAGNGTGNTTGEPAPAPARTPGVEAPLAAAAVAAVALAARRRR